MERQPGAYVVDGGTIKPDLNDEAMKARQEKPVPDKGTKKEASNAEK